jgi:3-oxoacyl-[acyl-carrier-protein] synthase III
MEAIYLSAPGIKLPAAKWTNEDQLAEVRRHFHGSDKEWAKVQRRLQFVFRLCGSDERYYEPDVEIPIADYAVDAARATLEAAGVAVDELDMLINGSVARDYFEPATAMEISAKLGLTEVHAFDVTSACAGLLQGVHITTAFMNMYPDVQRAVVGAADLTKGRISYDVQSKEDVAIRAAGLTIGDGASAFVVSRTPMCNGGRVLGMLSESLPQHYHLCSAPVDGSFNSLSGDLFKLHKHMPDHTRRLLHNCGKTPADVDHWICHQPSDSVVKTIMEDLEVDLAKAPMCHGLFGNTINSTVPMTLDHVLHDREVKPGDLLLLSTAAAGFMMVSLLLEWGAGSEE